VPNGSTIANDELERLRKKVMTYLKVLLSLCLEGLNKTTRRLFQNNQPPAENRIRTLRIQRNISPAMFNASTTRFWKVICFYLPLSKTFIFKLLKIADKPCRPTGIGCPKKMYTHKVNIPYYNVYITFWDTLYILIFTVGDVGI
jgi:hypothetical protein